MKNLLFVSVALSVFTVTSNSAAGQTRTNALKDFFVNGEGIVYNPPTVSSRIYFATVAKVAEGFTSPFTVATELCSKLQFKYAQLMNRDVESLTNLSLLSFIDDWWGTRYRYGGSTKKGIDCSSFTGALMNEVFGISLPRTAREQFAMCTRVCREEMEQGDLVFFNTRGGVSHVGVYLGNGYFVHSSCGAGVTISSLEESYYNKRFIGGGRPAAGDCIAGNM